jgi:DNA repair ATPase RecN
MGIFTNGDKRLLKEFLKKSEHNCHDIEKEIDEFLVDLQSEYEENSFVLNEFSEFVNELRDKLHPTDASRLAEFSTRLARVKRCARKGVEALREISRDQRKMTRDTFRDYEEYLHLG